MPLATPAAPTRLPPVWVLGLTNSTFGLFAGFIVITLPALLAAQGVPGGRVAAITTTILSPGFAIFLLAPLLDVRFSRRAYALVFSSLAAIAIPLTILHSHHLLFVEVVMLLGYIAASLTQAAVGGWVGTITTHAADGKLGSWFAVATVGPIGVMALGADALFAHTTPRLASLLLAALVLSPSLLYLVIPPPPSDRLLAHESFSRLRRELLLLLRRRSVRLALLLFALPSASFTLTNILSGLGDTFHASAHLVGVLAGIGSTLAGILGSLLLPLFSRRLPLRPLYLLIGITGAIFSLSLVFFHRTPATFAVAITGETLFQALAFATANAITFDTIGPRNPLASTQFALLVAATNLPQIYMGYLDAHAYTTHGLSGTLLTDATISLVVCLLLALVLTRLRPEPTHEP